MPIEIASEAITSLGEKFGHTTSTPGKEVSVWAVRGGAARDGFMSEHDLVNRGLPFGHGDRRLVKGFRTGKLSDGKKESDNVIDGPGGCKLVELIIDAKSMNERTEFEGELSTSRVNSAVRESRVNSIDENISRRTSVTDETIFEAAERQQLLAS